MNEKVDERWICVGWSSGSPASPSRLSPHLYTGTKGPGLSLSSSVGLSWESTGHALNRRRQTASLILNLCQVLLLLLLSRFSCVRLCAALQTVVHQASRPWDSPGKNTGVGCHFLLQCMEVKSESEVTQSCPTPSDPTDCSPQAPPSMGFSRQEYGSGVPLPSPSARLEETKKWHKIQTTSLVYCCYCYSVS